MPIQNNTLDRYERQRQDEMNRYRKVYPQLIFGSGMSAFKVDILANVPKLLLNVDRPKAFMMTNINNPENTPIFIGANQAVSVDSGFPIVSGAPLMFGVAENTEVWGIALVDMTIYFLDMGL